MINRVLSSRIVSVLLGISLGTLSFQSQVFSQSYHHKRFVLRDNLVAPGGLADNGFPLKIALAPGYGVTINFSSLGESIQSVWLDNPSFATLDTNAPNGQGNSTVLHLKMIETLKIDGVINTATSGLTVVTVTPDGKNNVYLFKVVKSRYPQAQIIDFYRPARREINACGKYGIEAEIAAKKNSRLVSTLKLGIDRAYARGFLKVNSPLNSRLNQFMSKVNCGMAVNLATAQTGLSNQLIDSLLEIGREKPIVKDSKNEVSNATEKPIRNRD